MKIRGFTNIDKNISSNDGTPTTPRKHLLTLLEPNTNKPLFKATERSNNNSILFVFKKEHMETAKNYINNMKRTLSEEFTQETINQIISPKIIKEQLNNSTVTTYKSFLMEANPQKELPGEPIKKLTISQQTNLNQRIRQYYRSPTYETYVDCNPTSRFNSQTPPHLRN